MINFGLSGDFLSLVFRLSKIPVLFALWNTTKTFSYELHLVLH